MNVAATLELAVATMRRLGWTTLDQKDIKTLDIMMIYYRGSNLN